MPTPYTSIAGQSVERLAALSDGVFAIAMTLLVLDLRVPAAAALHGNGDLFRHVFVALAPRFVPYLLSFMSLGIYWIAQNNRARAIWDLTGQLDLSRYFSKIRSKAGKAGSPAWHPQLLLSVWLYAYSEQMTSAREVARVMEYEPGLMWLSGLGEVNYHKLSGKEYRVLGVKGPSQARKLVKSGMR